MIDGIDYEAIVQEALRGAIPLVLKKFLQGPPGDHHLYITFRTARIDVSLPEALLAKYPEEMTVVLQHRYWDLDVGAATVAVKMQFSGVTTPMMIGYGAITRLYDPAAQFLLQFQEADAELLARDLEIDWSQAESPKSTAEAIRDAMLGPQSAVVSLDQFRKR